MKPRLTAPVMRGLVSMASLIEAGSEEDFMGQFGAHERRAWSDVQRALAWIRAMDRHRDERTTLENSLP